MGKARIIRIRDEDCPFGSWIEMPQFKDLGWLPDGRYIKLVRRGGRIRAMESRADEDVEMDRAWRFCDPQEEMELIAPYLKVDAEHSRQMSLF